MQKTRTASRRSALSQGRGAGGRGRKAAARGIVVGVVVAGGLLGAIAVAHARTAAPAANGDWTLPGRTPQGTRYSPLKMITPQNVGTLHEVWSYTDSIKDGHEGQPLVVHNTLYMVTPFPIASTRSISRSRAPM